MSKYDQMMLPIVYWVVNDLCIDYLPSGMCPSVEARVVLWKVTYWSPVWLLALFALWGAKYWFDRRYLDE